MRNTSTTESNETILEKGSLRKVYTLNAEPSNPLPQPSPEHPQVPSLQNTTRPKNTNIRDSPTEQPGQITLHKAHSKQEPPKYTEFPVGHWEVGITRHLRWAYKKDRCQKTGESNSKDGYRVCRKKKT